MSFGNLQTPDAVGDSTTGDLLPNHDLAGERPPKKSRGAAWREKKGLSAFTVNVSTPVKHDFDAYLKRTGKNRNEVIERLLKTQLLRAR